MAVRDGTMITELVLNVLSDVQDVEGDNKEKEISSLIPVRCVYIF